MADLDKEHTLARDNMTIETKKLREQIERMMKNHTDEREQIENEAWVEIDQMKEQNTEALA